ncbi:hypothetical protein D3C86_2201440 [compost metagenome]
MLQPVKGLQHLLALRLRNPWPAVLNIQHALNNAGGDYAAFRRIFNGVIQQVSAELRQ